MWPCQVGSTLQASRNQLRDCESVYIGNSPPPLAYLFDMYSPLNSGVTPKLLMPSPRARRNVSFGILVQNSVSRHGQADDVLAAKQVLTNLAL